MNFPGSRGNYGQTNTHVPSNENISEASRRPPPPPCWAVTADQPLRRDVLTRRAARYPEHASISQRPPALHTREIGRLPTSAAILKEGTPNTKVKKSPADFVEDSDGESDQEAAACPACDKSARNLPPHISLEKHCWESHLRCVICVSDPRPQNERSRGGRGTMTVEIGLKHKFWPTKDKLLQHYEAHIRPFFCEQYGTVLCCDKHFARDIDKTKHEKDCTGQIKLLSQAEQDYIKKLRDELRETMKRAASLAPNDLAEAHEKILLYHDREKGKLVKKVDFLKTHVNNLAKVLDLPPMGEEICNRTTANPEPVGRVPIDIKKQVDEIKAKYSQDAIIQAFQQLPLKPFQRFTSFSGQMPSAAAQPIYASPNVPPTPPFTPDFIRSSSSCSTDSVLMPRPGRPVPSHPSNINNPPSSLTHERHQSNHSHPLRKVESAERETLSQNAPGNSRVSDTAEFRCPPAPGTINPRDLHYPNQFSQQSVIPSRLVNETLRRDIWVGRDVPTPYGGVSLDPEPMDLSKTPAPASDPQDPEGYYRIGQPAWENLSTS